MTSVIIEGSGTTIVEETNLTRVITQLGGMSGIIKQGSFYASTPVDGTIVLVSYVVYPFTIRHIYGLKTSSGTIVASFQINGVAVTGLDGITVSSVTQNAAATAANLAAVGDRITLVLSSNSSAAGLEFGMKGTV